MIYPVKCSGRDKGDFLWRRFGPFFYHDRSIENRGLELDSVFLKEEVLNIINQFDSRRFLFYVYFISRISRVLYYHIHSILFSSMLLKKNLACCEYEIFMELNAFSGKISISRMIVAENNTPIIIYFLNSYCNIKYIPIIIRAISSSSTFRPKLNTGQAHSASNVKCANFSSFVACIRPCNAAMKATLHHDRPN